MNATINKQGKARSNSAVLLVEESISSVSPLAVALKSHHFHVVAQIENDSKLSEMCLQLHPDLMIIKTDAPSANTLKELTLIDQLTPLPVLIFATLETQSLIKSSIKAGVSAYIVNDMQPHRLNSLIAVAVERFKERQMLRTELEETKTQLANRKVVERAKGCIMQQKNITEDEAFQLLRKMAMNNGQSLAVVAKNVTDVYDLMNQ